MCAEYTLRVARASSVCVYYAIGASTLADRLLVGLHGGTVNAVFAWKFYFVLFGLAIAD